MTAVRIATWAFSWGALILSALAYWHGPRRPVTSDDEESQSPTTDTTDHRSST